MSSYFILVIFYKKNEQNKEEKKIGIGWVIASNEFSKNSISFNSRIAN